MTNDSNRHRVRNAFVAMAAMVLVGALPAALVAVARNRLGHASPLDGVNAPWRWTLADLHSWASKLTRGLDSSHALVDLFFRAALIGAWVCFAVLLVTVVGEVVFQLRHGMPSAHHRSLGGLGPLGRRLATSLVALLPLSIGAHPALSGAYAPRPPIAASVVAGARDARPEAVPQTSTLGWTVVEVKRGDSVWSIAERVAAGRDVSALAAQIVAANLGSEMLDGQTFATPALIEPGWVLNVPARRGAGQELVPPGAADDYVVERGDSYWKIAEEHLDPSATGSEIAAYTTQLIAINAPELGYRDERLIRPGDVLHLGAVAAEASADDTTAAPTPPPVHDAPSLPPPDPAAASTPLPPPTTATPPTSTPPPPLMAVPGPSSTLPAGTNPLVTPQLVQHDDLPASAGLAAAATLAASVVAVLAVRRRGRLRSAEVGARFLPAAPPLIDMERRLRAASVTDPSVRVDVALRAVAPLLAAQGSRVLAVEVDETGVLRVHTTERTMPRLPWVGGDDGTWVLPPEVGLADLADDARRSQQPCPALVHLGNGERGELFVDLEAIGLLSIDAPANAAKAVLRAVAVSLAVSPFATSTHVFTVGLQPEVQLGSPWSEAEPSLADAIDSMGRLSAAIALATHSTSTFALRVAAGDGDTWEPSVLLCCGVDDTDDLACLGELSAGGGRGVAVVVDCLVAGSDATLRLSDGGFVLLPLGIRFRPVGVSSDEVVALGELLAVPEAPLPVDVVPISSSRLEPFVPSRHQFVVRILGQVEVRSVEGVSVRFDRSKALELVVWLSQHRHRPTRGSARAALWETAVRDATFSNVVSEARRALAKVVPPPSGQEWIGRTLNDDLPLHDLVVSDVELLAERVEAARRLPLDESIAILRPAVASIEGMPFAGTSYLWPDAEGIASSAVLLATSAAAVLAGHYLDAGDVDGVFWATGQGLKVLSGHEELIALRMRAHASRGDLAGVRGEWESYERALQADSWAAAEPSPKLVDLRGRLLSPSMVP